MARFLLILGLLLIGLIDSVFGASANSFRVHESSPHKVKIFGHGLSSFEERLRLIESAKKSIDIEYFIVKADLSSRIFLQSLLDKKKSGVRIRMLIDHTFSASGFTPAIAAELVNKGIEVRYFNPISKWSILKVQYRNHRKSLIIDSETMMTGGRNIGDEYFDLNKRFKFLDRDIVISGKIVQEIQTTFEETFYSELSVDASALLKKEDLKKENQLDVKKYLFERVASEEYLKIRNFAKIQYEETKIEGVCKSASFISEFPDIGRKNKRYHRQVKYDLANRLQEATEEVIIDSPYFITDHLFKNVFKDILSKGVEIKLLTNSLHSTDVPIGAAAFDREVVGWIKKGMKPYVYKGVRPDNYQVISDFYENSKFAVHAKTFIFDNKDIYIGSYNLDPRSANYNTELMIGCEDSPEVAQEVKAEIEARMEHALFLESKSSFKEARFYSVNFAKKMKYYLSILPAVLFKHWL